VFEELLVLRSTLINDFSLGWSESWKSEKDKDLRRPVSKHD